MKTFANTLLTALTPIIWGSTYLVTTEFLPPNQPFTAAVVRTLPVGVLLLLWHRVVVPRRQWGRLIILSGLNIVLLQASLFIAAYRLPGGLAAVVGSAQPLIILFLTWALDQRRPSRLALTGALVAIAGMAALFATPSRHLDPIGLAAAATGTLSIATGTFLARRWQQRLPVLAFTGWQLLIGGCILAPFAGLLDPPSGPLTPTHWAGFAYLSLIGSLLAYPLWFRGIARLSPLAVSALGLLGPVTALLLGWHVLGESLSASQLIALAVVLAAVLVLQWRPAPPSVATSLPGSLPTSRPRPPQPISVS